MELKEYIVTLWRREDLDDFYDDMETPGGSLYIPDRNVDVTARRSISRNTHYMLTEDEVDEIIKDDRVRGVCLKSLIDDRFDVGLGYTESGNWKRDNFVPSATENNWGMYRTVIGANALGGTWGSDGTSTASASFTITASGKNVDVLIVDGTVDPTHPELQVNSDGTGGSRVQQFNWFSLAAQLGLGVNGTYDYTTVGSAADNAHGTHVAGTVAGSTLGWAREANIYNMEFKFSGNVNYDGPQNLLNSTKYDYIREWHNTKAINPETGRRNPTISNHSYGGGLTRDFILSQSLDGVAGINWRGTLDIKPAGQHFSDAEIEARGLNVPADGNWVHGALELTPGSYTTAINSDVEDAIADGIIIVAAAGNDGTKIVNSTDQDYNNLFYYDQGGSIVASSYYHRSGQSWGGELDNAVSLSGPIVVGAVSIESNDRKASFSQTGSLVDIYAPGYGIVSCVSGTGNVQDPRNNSYWLSKYSGTSMASPQVAGVLALLAESNQNLNQEEAKQWLIDQATNSEMFDSGTDSATDFTSLQGGPNKILFWKNQRPEAGTTVPKLNTKSRPPSSRVWPRPRIRAKG